MSAPFDFEEQRNQVYYHNIRVFIYGADVTPWLTSSVTIKKADRNGINTCTFSLSNAYRCMEITEENVTLGKDGSIKANIFRMFDPYSPEGKYSELAKNTIFVKKQKGQVSHEVKTFGPVKESGKSGGVILNSKGATRDSSKAQSDVTLRYPMVPGSLIFNKYDPIRVFIQDPLRRTSDAWFQEFAGYIDTKPFSQNYVNGESIINVACQDIRMLMQNMRTQNNPAAQVGNENTLGFGASRQLHVKDRADAGFFNDFVGDTMKSHIVGGMTFDQSIKFLTIGFDKGASTKTKNKNQGAIGNFSIGETIDYDVMNKDDDARKKSLEKWNNIVLFGSTQKFLTEDEMLNIGSNCYSGGSHSPDNQKIHFLYPAKNAPTSNLVQFYTADTNTQAKIEWGTRLELIIQMCKNIDYQFYISGSGDMIVEFPMYDFMPDEFNVAYNKLYSFSDHIISDNINDEGGTPVTALIVTGSILRREIAQGNPTEVDAIPGHAASAEITRTVFSNVLASRVGVHVETFSVPGVENQGRLAQIAMIEFNKRQANYNKLDVTATYRPYIGVNRPIYHRVKNRIGISETVTYAFNLRAEVTMTIDLSYIRRKEANGAFRFITGGERSPISYSSQYLNAYVPGQGINNTGSGEGEGGPPGTPIGDTKSNTNPK